MSEILTSRPEEFVDVPESSFGVRVRSDNDEIFLEYIHRPSGDQMGGVFKVDNLDRRLTGREWLRLMKLWLGCARVQSGRES